MPPSHAQSSGGPQNALGIKFGGEQTATPPMDGLKTLIGAMSALNESAGYRELTHVLKEVESLRTELKTKESTIKQLEMGNQEAREKFAFANESLVDVRRKHCTELETERDDLAKEVTAMRETMKQKNQSQKVLEEQQAQMQAEVAKSQEDLNSRIASAREERQRYLRLDQEFNAAKGEIEQLKADARDKAVEISKLKESKTSLEEKHYELRQSLQSSEQELERLQGMAVELKIEPLATT
jgi:chromosome segregation ATPase